MKLTFEEPAAHGNPAVEVYATNPDELYVTLSAKDHDDSVTIAYWQLERIVHRLRQEFAFQLDREQPVHRPAHHPQRRELR